MSRSASRRARVGALLKASLADAIVRRVKDPRIGFTTITRVDVSGDLSVATVMVSVMGTEEEKTNTLKGLECASGFLRSHVARELSFLRIVPEIRFQLDRGLEHFARITELLDEQKEGGSD